MTQRTQALSLGIVIRDCDLRLRQNITHNGIFVIFFSHKNGGSELSWKEMVQLEIDHN